MRHADAHTSVVKLLIRPVAPTGAGAGDHERTSRTQDTKSVRSRFTLAVTAPQPSSVTRLCE